MPTPSSVSAESLAAVSTLIDRLPPGESVALDPGDSIHRAAIEAGLAAAGRTPERYPALFAALGGGARAGGDSLVLVDRGADESGRATATVWQASPEGTTFAGGTLFALDARSGALLALGHNSAVRQGFLPVSTDTASARPAGSALKLLSVFHSVSPAGEARFTALSAEAAVAAEMGDGVATVTIPTSTPIHKNPTYVQIGVNRPNQQGDCDYWYKDNAAESPFLIVPFVGSALLPYQVDGTPGQPVPGAFLTQIYYQGGGAPVAMNTTYTKNFQSAVKMSSTNPNQVEWSYPYTAGQSYTNTTSLVYNAAPVNDLKYSYFFYSFEIPVKDGPTPTFSFNVCSVDTPDGKTKQCTMIPNMVFVWHCLAAGTQVTLADGSRAAIEEVDNCRRVRTGEGDADLAVEATTRGLHKASAGDAFGRAIYRLTTTEGHELVASGTHPVVTPGGLLPLHALQAGGEVMTEGGVAGVAACEAVDHEGLLFNLKLGDDGDRAAGLAPDAVNTFVANGILVGDVEAQWNEHHRLSRDMDHMSSVLPPELVTDYSSAIDDIRY